LRRRPGPQPPPPTHDEVFLRLYQSALQGVASQFEIPAQPGHKPFNMEGEGELIRSRALARRAWNLARFASSMWEQDRTVTSFNEEVG
jgi:hypothetical protein